MTYKLHRYDFCGRPNATTTLRSLSAVFRAPQHPQLRGRGAQTLEGAAREWEKFPLELKRAIPGYATDVFGNVFVMLFTSC